MRLRHFPFLVLVLLASAWVDDAWEAAAAAPAAESLAAVDNVYITSPARAGEERARRAPLPPPGAALPAGDRSCPARYPPESARAIPPFGAPLLYILMSLQR
jgi:hypothetical protein